METGRGAQPRHGVRWNRMAGSTPFLPIAAIRMSLNTCSVHAIEDFANEQNRHTVPLGLPFGRPALLSLRAGVYREPLPGVFPFSLRKRNGARVLQLASPLLDVCQQRDARLPALPPTRSECRRATTRNRLRSLPRNCSARATQSCVPSCGPTSGYPPRKSANCDIFRIEKFCLLGRTLHL